MTADSHTRYTEDGQRSPGDFKISEAHPDIYKDFPTLLEGCVLWRFVEDFRKTKEPTVCYSRCIINKYSHDFKCNLDYCRHLLAFTHVYFSKLHLKSCDYIITFPVNQFINQSINQPNKF